MVCKYFLSFYALPLHFIDCIFCYAKACAFGVISKISLRRGAESTWKLTCRRPSAVSLMPFTAQGRHSRALRG
jgi:hypothetical protein